MKTIMQRLYLFLALGIAGIMISTCYLITLISQGKTDGLIVLPALATILQLGLFWGEYKKYNHAKLIVDNKIFKIEAVIIEEDRNSLLPIRGIEVVISCFGILLGSEIIKFNIDGIRLKEVEIGKKYICFTYGTDNRMEKTMILHGGIEDQELKTYIERFRYETGIVPKILD